MKPNPSEKQDAPEAPAKITANHAQDYLLSAGAGANHAWRNHGEHPLMLALFREKIDRTEYDAGNLYRRYYEQMGRSGKDSTDLSVVGGGSGLPFTQTQVDAIHAVQAIERRIQQPYDVIVRKFCGEGYSASEAVRAARFHNPKNVWEKMRLALNKLATAVAASGVSRGGFEDE